MIYPGSLHNHTDYSNLRLRDSTNKIKDLLQYAIDLNHEVIAFTEHECISNAVIIEKEYKKIKEKNPNFKCILGNEIYLCRDGLNKDNFNKETDNFYHFILLAKDEIGHKQIRQLSTKAWIDNTFETNRMRRVPTYYKNLQEIIGKEPGHIIMSTACLGGFLPKKILEWYTSKDSQLYDRIKKWCLSMQQLNGGKDFYLEMQPSNTEEQIIVNKQLLQLSKELNIPYIITTDSHYLNKDKANIHKAFLTAQEGEREVDSFYKSTYLMDTKELESYFEYFTKEDLEISYNNILKIKNDCADYSLLKPLNIPQLKWKDYDKNIINKDKWIKNIPYLETFWNSDCYGDQVLADKIVIKLESDIRLQTDISYNELNDNLKIVWQSSLTNKTNWSKYFLNLQNIIDICWTIGLVGPGRGSGVGFYLLYILDIIQINPLWETTKCFSWRFLNPERVSVLD